MLVVDGSRHPLAGRAAWSGCASRGSGSSGEISSGV